jgi:hypothetical protein
MIPQECYLGFLNSGMCDLVLTPYDPHLNLEIIEATFLTNIYYNWNESITSIYSDNKAFPYSDCET